MRVLFLFLVGSSYVHAECSGDYKELIFSFYNAEKVQRHVPVCKEWAAKGLIVSATAIKSGEGIDMGIAVIDPKAKEIIGSTREVDMLTNTAIYNTEISIDTANYRLSSQTSAFGIRTSWRGSSIPNPYEVESLSLYVLNGTGLDKILSDLAVQEQTGEWDTVCEGSFVARRMTLAFAPSSKKYSDIDVEEKITITKSTASAGVCTDVSSKPETKPYSIKYLNGFYEVPQELRSFIQPD